MKLNASFDVDDRTRARRRLASADCGVLLEDERAPVALELTTSNIGSRIKLLEEIV
jgi:hypothetical protein